MNDLSAAYDAVTVQYAELFGDVSKTGPLDRALVEAFAELTRAAGPVADLGCGPGHLTAHLHALGCAAFGLDLSPAMIAHARRTHPDLRFDVGSMTSLDAADGTLGGILTWYSMIHSPPERVPATLTEFHRVLAPGGYLLLGFFEDDGPAPQPFDHKVSLAYRWPLDRLAELLDKAGFTEIARMSRVPEDTERFQHGRLLVRKPH
ncbi:class I SAM-dependent methyltransferase [Actinomadura rubrisoli]|uniref:Class I SAM-dependent methyltransferase n=1 Tax=Actinomadura rubrisoli TaxID=2530368 RepID=A0A4R5AXA1_9ACTN|nr:class I SAM-dependent methyltransferase [Actinomadura rubrisoli]TDD76649.1 class I SAM-dependent methyltransferase [Actinomadura rubrisoli]